MNADIYPHQQERGTEDDIYLSHTFINSTCTGCPTGGEGGGAWVEDMWESNVAL